MTAWFICFLWGHEWATALVYLNGKHYQRCNMCQKYRALDP